MPLAYSQKLITHEGFYFIIYVTRFIKKCSSQSKLDCSQIAQQDVDNFGGQLTSLSQLSDQLTPHMDNATIIQITARETALGQRLLNMQQALARHLQSLQDDLDKHSRFDSAFTNVDGFLAQADDILCSEDPNKSAEEPSIRERLDQFKNLAGQFTERQPDLETVNLIGYRLPLNEADSQRMRQLNQRWYNLAADTAERYKTMQSHLLLQQDFNQKCEEWMLFLAQVEKDLATDIAGNYESLLEQQQAYEVSLTLLKTYQFILLRYVI